MPLVLAQEGASIRHGIEPARIRQLVHQRLHHEGVVRVADRAPPQHRHIDLRLVHFQRDRERIGALGHALCQRRVDAVLHDEGFERAARGDRLADDHVLPRQHFAFAVVPDLDAV